MSSSSCLTNSTSSVCENSTSTILSTSVISGVAVGGFFLVLLISAFIICVYCWKSKRFSTHGRHSGIIRPWSFDEQPSVITVSPNERFNPPYMSPRTYNPNPATIHRPSGRTIRQKPPASRPISVRPSPSAPPLETPEPQVINPRFYQTPNDSRPAPNISITPSAPPSYSESVPNIPTWSDEPPPYSE